MRLLFVAAALLSLTGCQRDFYVEEAWIRLPAVSGRPAALYFRAQAGDHAERILTVRGPFERAELHETSHHGSMAAMQPIDQIDLKPLEKISFEPGGKHAMLFRVDPSLKPGSKVRLQLSHGPISNGQPTQVQQEHFEAKVVSAAESSPYNSRWPF